MTPERWQELKALLDALLQLPPDERPQYLDRMCSDEPLRRDIESLIQHGDAAGGLSEPLVSRTELTLTNEPDGSDSPTARASFEGQRIGAYRLLHEIGRGGMGTVYLAARDDDAFKKRVAIKLLRNGMETETVMRRFHNERQILAGINHPYVAELHDGGTTEDGRPYFVMEYIEGRPIDEYSDACSLTITERLKLFRKVCSAVQFAHQNLVVHRDLKPANILVTKEGQPKLLDFGIAKLLNPDIIAGTLDATGFEMRLMTPEYASPEQVRGELITTASDVYSLGVVLYELLTGHRPYQLESRQLDEIARVICDQEPAAPSLVIDAVAEVRGSKGTLRQLTPETVSKTREGTIERLRRRLKGDLDNVVLMAMRKEPKLRYASAEQFSEDLRRVTEGLPVKARKATFSYRGGKFVRRHRAAVSAASLGFVLSIGFGVTMAVQSGRLAQERDRAETAAETAKVINEFLQETLGSANPYVGQGREVTVLEVLAQAESKIRDSFDGQPEIRAALEHTIGVTYRQLGQYQKAEPLLRSAVEIRKRALGESHLDVAESLSEVGMLYLDKGDYDAARPFLDDALSMRRRLLGPEHQKLAASLHQFGTLLFHQADYPGAEALFREALTMERRLIGNESPRVAEILNDLGLLMRQDQDLEGAEKLHREALAIHRRLFGEEHPLIAMDLNNLALVLKQRGDYDAAEPLYREALAMQRKLLGESHPVVATDLTNLANLLQAKQDYDGAERLYREAILMQRNNLGEQHPDLAQSLNNLAFMLRSKGDYERAKPLFREAIAIFREIFGANHQTVGVAITNLAVVFAEQGNDAAALPLYRQALEVWEKALGRQHWLTAYGRSNYGACLAKLGKYEEAEVLLLSAHPVIEAKFGQENERTRKSKARLVELYESWGQPEKADPYRPTEREE